MAARIATFPQLGAAVQRVLAERGPLDEDELLAALVEDGVALGPEPGERLAELLERDEADLVLELDSGRLVFLPAFLDGRVFTHRLTTAEIEHDLLAVTPDLEPLSMLTDDERWCRLHDGAILADLMAGFDDEVIKERGIPPESLPPDGAWSLPPGRLRQLGCRAGNVLGVRVTPDGLALERIDGEPGTPDDLAAELRATFDRRRGEPQFIFALAWALCEADDARFRSPVAPLSEVFERLGLVHESDQVGPEGFNFVAWRLQRHVERVERRYGLAEDEARAVVLLHQMYEHFDTMLALLSEDGGDDDPDEESWEAGHDGAGETDDDETDADGPTFERLELDVMAATVEYLERPPVAQALLDETLAERGSAAGLGLLTEIMAERASGSSQAALRWLRGKASERLGEIAEAEQDFERALEFDSEWEPALIDLARYASDRGDAGRGLMLLRRVKGGEDDPLVELLSHFRSRPRSGLGRNDRCWCGSGRKYKQCHLGNEQLPIEERAAWLYHKAGQYLVEGPWRSELIDVALERSRNWRSDDAFLEALGDPLVGDAMLFEGGAFEDFLATRGELLPDDELLLAEQWLLVERSLFEVDATRPGESMTMRDVRSGDRHVVRERTASRDVDPGALICCRVVPAGETMQIFGGIEPIPLHHRDQLIELLDGDPEPSELVAFLSSRFAPPVMQNTEGDPLVLCTADVKVPDPLALAAALDDTYRRVDHEAPVDGDSEEQRWTEYVTTRGVERVRATLRLDGDVLAIDTNSEERMDRVLTVVEQLQPDAEIISEERNAASDLLEAHRAGRDDDAGPADDEVDMNDPEMAAMLDQFIREYQERWLDEEIPALAGRTPRAAAADPTRRDDLVRLLDSFGPSQPGAMDPARLRAALDL